MLSISILILIIALVIVFDIIVASLVWRTLTSASLSELEAATLSFCFTAIGITVTYVSIIEVINA